MDFKHLARKIAQYPWTAEAAAATGLAAPVLTLLPETNPTESASASASSSAGAEAAAAAALAEERKRTSMAALRADAEAVLGREKEILRDFAKEGGFAVDADLFLQVYSMMTMMHA